MTENCVFCQIIRRQVPASVIYQDDRVIAFLSNRPVNVGHTLVVPRKHYANVFEVPEDEIAYLARVVKRMAQAVKDAVGAEGIRIVQNNGEAAGQVVFHFHMHVIPMKPSNQHGHDNVFRDPTHFREADALEQDAVKIRQNLN